MIPNHLKIAWPLKYKELGGGIGQKNCLKVLVDMDKIIINYISYRILRMKSLIKKKWNKKKIVNCKESIFITDLVTKIHTYINLLTYKSN